MADAAFGRGRRVSLSEPRPEAARAQNEYSEAPLPSSYRLNNNSCRPVGVGVHGQFKKKEKKAEGLPQSGLVSSSAVPPVRTEQPKASDKPASGASPQPPSIICRECGKCRCESCREPRRPPSAWLCSDLCYCSVDSCVDYASCLCCVKGLLYHCGPREEWADDPCSCSSSKWLSRWSCLALASVFLPCLCCYCPLRALADLCESGYATCTHRGCTCQRPLLDSSLSSPPHSTL